ncbi:MAG: sigma-70 family RNA polymerase sigma factor [Acidobacteriota bacterium]|nr:sigma-70 family RNA polymerase sigma factor [Acidobacteriota bacterium]
MDPTPSVPTPERQQLVIEYLALVRVIAWQIYGSLPVHASVELSDMIQAGHLGLVNASHSYRTGNQVPFASYARHRIRGEILDSLRRMDSASRGLRRWQRRIETETRNLSLSLKREPTEEEMSQRLGVEIDKLRQRRLALWRSSSCSSTSVLSEESPNSSLFRLTTLDGEPDSIQRRRELRQFLSRAVAILPPRSRKVVLLYYLRNLTMKQIGAVLLVNESRISQIHKHALKTMARGLRSAGVRCANDI